MGRRLIRPSSRRLSLIGEEIVGSFTSFGEMGMLAALALLVLVDGAGVPTVPEVWLVFFFGAHPETFAWGLTIAIVASVAGLGGILIQYSLARFARLPKKVGRVMKRYTDFLILHDERLLLLNKAAPMIPYSGAFVALLGWDLKKSLAYSFLGALGKTTMIVTLTYFTYGGLAREVAGWVSIVVVGCVMGSSLVFSLILKRKYGLVTSAKKSPTF